MAHSMEGSKSRSRGEYRRVRERSSSPRRYSSSREPRDHGPAHSRKRTSPLYSPSSRRPTTRSGHERHPRPTTSPQSSPPEASSSLWWSDRRGPEKKASLYERFLDASKRKDMKPSRKGPVSRKSLYREEVSHRAELLKRLLDRVSSGGSSSSNRQSSSAASGLAAVLGSSCGDGASGRYTDPSPFSEEDFGYGSYDSSAPHQQYRVPVPALVSRLESAPVMSQGRYAMASRETEFDFEAPYGGFTSPSLSLSPSPSPSPSPSSLFPSFPSSHADQVCQLGCFASSKRVPHLEESEAERQPPLRAPCYPIPTSIDYMKKRQKQRPEKPKWFHSPLPGVAVERKKSSNYKPSSSYDDDDDDCIYNHNRSPSPSPFPSSLPPSLSRRHTTATLPTAYDDSGPSVTPAYTYMHSSSSCCSGPSHCHHSSATLTSEPVGVRISHDRSKHYYSQPSSSSSLSLSPVKRLKLSGLASGSRQHGRSSHDSSGNHHSSSIVRNRTSHHGGGKQLSSSRSLETCLESPHSNSVSSFAVVESLGSFSESLGSSSGQLRSSSRQAAVDKRSSNSFLGGSHKRHSPLEAPSGSSSGKREHGKLSFDKDSVALPSSRNSTRHSSSKSTSSYRDYESSRHSGEKRRSRGSYESARSSRSGARNKRSSSPFITVETLDLPDSSAEETGSSKYHSEPSSSSSSSFDRSRSSRVEMPASSKCNEELHFDGSAPPLYLEDGKEEEEEECQIIGEEIRACVPLSKFGKRVVAIDCEMVGCLETYDFQAKRWGFSGVGGIKGLSGGKKRKKTNYGPYKEVSVAARCAIVNYSGKVIYDRFIRPHLKILSLRGFVTGITYKDLEDAVPFETARAEICEILEDCLVAGHDISQDLMSLAIMLPFSQVRDTCRYRGLRTLAKLDEHSTPSLKNLTRKLLHKDIQSRSSYHCPREDAMATMQLYKLVEDQWENDG